MGFHVPPLYPFMYLPYIFPAILTEEGERKSRFDNPKTKASAAPFPGQTTSSLGGSKPES